MKIVKSVIYGLLCLGVISSCAGKSIKELLPDLDGILPKWNAESEKTSPDGKYSPVNAELSLDEDDRELISWVIACEAGDRSYEAQVCLGAVILNRITDDGFSEDARGVIFESGDFASVTKGLVTGGVSEAQKQTDKYKTASKALEEALAHDPTGGALYFGYVTDGAALGTGSYKCGGMVFGR